MSTRLASNYSTYWPIYDLKKNRMDFTIDRLNPYAAMPPQVIPTPTTTRTPKPASPICYLWWWVTWICFVLCFSVHSWLFARYAFLRNQLVRFTIFHFLLKQVFKPIIWEKTSKTQSNQVNLNSIDRPMVPTSVRVYYSLTSCDVILGCSLLCWNAISSAKRFVFMVTCNEWVQLCGTHTYVIYNVSVFYCTTDEYSGTLSKVFRWVTCQE